MPILSGIDSQKDKIIKLFREGIKVSEIARRTNYKANTVRFNLTKWGELIPKTIERKGKSKEMPDVLTYKYFLKNPIF